MNRDPIPVRSKVNADKAVLMAAFGKLDIPAFTIALGFTFAILLFFLTAVLLLKGAPNGTEIGGHLKIISQFFPGYTVTWGGSVFAVVYGFLTGAIVGFVWATLWNLGHYLYIILVAVRAQWWQMMHD